MSGRIWIELVDVAAEARKRHGDVVTEIWPDVPEHDWRFEVTYGADWKLITGEGNKREGDGCVCFPPGATAADVAKYLEDADIAVPSTKDEGGSE